MRNMLIDRFETSFLTALTLLPMVELDYDDSGLRHVDIRMGDWCKAVRVNNVPIIQADGHGGFIPCPIPDLKVVFSDVESACESYNLYEQSGKTASDLYMLVDSLLAAASSPPTFDTDDLAARQLLNTVATYVNGGYLNSWHIRLDFWDDPEESEATDEPAD